MSGDNLCVWETSSSCMPYRGTLSDSKYYLSPVEYLIIDQFRRQNVADKGNSHSHRALPWAFCIRHTYTQLACLHTVCKLSAIRPPPLLPFYSSVFCSYGFGVLRILSRVFVRPFHTHGIAWGMEYPAQKTDD